MKMRSAPEGSPNREPQEKNGVEPVTALRRPWLRTQHGMVLIIISGVDAQKK